MKNQNISKFSFSLVLIGAISLFSLNLNGQDFIIKDFNTRIFLQEDGGVKVKERISVFFNEKRRGIIRAIPLSYKNEGKTKKLNATGISVANSDFSFAQNKNNLEIKIGNKDVFVEGLTTYEISYTLYKPYLFLDDHIEWQQNIIGSWDTSIDSVYFEVDFYKDLDLAFTDYQIESDNSIENNSNVKLERFGNKLIGGTKMGLKPNESLTLNVKLPAEFVAAPPPPVSIFETDKIWYWPTAFILALIGFFRKSRKEDTINTDSSVYFPPDNFSPSEVGAYHDHSVNIEDIIALLPYWAEKGFIEISPSNLTDDDKDLYFKKIKELPSSAQDYEILIFDNLFKNGDLILLSELKTKIYSVIHKASSMMKINLLSRNLYDWDHYNKFHHWRNIIISLALIILGGVITIATALTLTGISLVMIGITILILFFLRPKMTSKGAQINAHMKSLKNTLKNMTAEKTKELIDNDTRYFEKIYPYAIALGIDKDWMKNIESLDLQAPNWFYPTNNMNRQTVAMSSFSQKFSVPEIKSVFTSVPNTSGGSSGSSYSGGRAGGGFGGGGGRSW